MSLLKSRILAITVALVVFAGPATAMAVSSCRIDGDQSVSRNMTAMDHSSGAVDEQDSCPTSNMSDCCDQNCDCSSGNCATAVVSPVSYNIRDVIPLQKNNQPQLLRPGNPLLTLYHPPISL